MARVRDKTSRLPDHLLLLLEKCRERYIIFVGRINSLKLYSIGNLCRLSELSSSQQKFNDYHGLKKAAEGCIIKR